MAYSSWLALLIIHCSSASAGLNIQTYRDRNSSLYTLLDSSRSREEIEKNPIHESIVYHYLNNPIDYDQKEDGSGALIPYIHSINFAAEYSWNDHYSLGFDMPAHQLNFHGRESTFAFGDLRFFGRARLLGKSTKDGQFSIVPSAYAPTGSETYMLSNTNGGTGVNFVLEKTWASFASVMNIGADFFPNAKYKYLNYDLQYYAGLGTSLSLSEKLSVNMEWLGRQIHKIRTGDLYFGAEYKLSDTHNVFTGVSLASNQFNEDNLQYRIFAGLRIEPSSTQLVTRYIQKRIETREKSKKIYDCGPKPFAATFPSRALSENEIQELQSKKSLPYFSSRQGPIKTLRIGEFTGVTDSGLHYVKNAQVLFAVDLKNLPARDTLISLKRFDLVLYANKLWANREHKTDMLCLINSKICSGDFYDNRQMRENINPQFFFGKEPPNDYFLRQITASPPVSSGSLELTRAHMQLNMDKLIENSTLFDPLNIMYLNKGDSMDQPVTTLYFAVAHDVYISKSARLELELSIQYCTETNPTPSIETHEEEILLPDKGLQHEEN